MPYRSARQRAYMHIHLPEIAKEWDLKYGGKIVPSPKKNDEHKAEKPKPKQRV